MCECACLCRCPLFWTLLNKQLVCCCPTMFILMIFTEVFVVSAIFYGVKQLLHGIVINPN